MIEHQEPKQIPQKTFTHEEKVELAARVYRALDVFERAIADAHEAGLHPDVMIAGTCPTRIQLTLIESIPYKREEPTSPAGPPTEEKK